MVDEVGRARDVSAQRLIGVSLWGRERLRAEGLHGGLAADLEGETQALDHAAHVLGLGVELVVDDRLCARVIRGQLHRPARARREQARRDPHAVAFGVGHALVDDLHASDVELRVGGGRACLHAREAA